MRIIHICLYQKYIKEKQRRQKIKQQQQQNHTNSEMGKNVNWWVVNVLLCKALFIIYCTATQLCYSYINHFSTTTQHTTPQVKINFNFLQYCNAVWAEWLGLTWFSGNLLQLSTLWYPSLHMSETILFVQFAG